MRGVDFKKIRGFLFGLLLVSSIPSAFAQDDVEVDGGFFSVGINHLKTGRGTSDSGLSTQFGGYTANSGENETPLLFVNGRAHFNVANRNSQTREFSTNAGLKGSPFLAYSFLTHKRGENGADLYVGIQGNIDFNASAYSQHVSSFFGNIGPETGLHIKKEGFMMTLGGSVGYLGGNCGVKLDQNRTFVFSGGGVGLVGIGRIAVGDKLYGKVFYALIPTQTKSERWGNSPEFNVDRKLNMVDLVLYYRVTPEFEISLECSSTTFTYNGSDASQNESTGEVTLTPANRSNNMSTVQFGIVRRLDNY